ncbi:MAG: hypothetical protein WBQ41_16520 [Solirubrobacterales bacterium]
MATLLFKGEVRRVERTALNQAEAACVLRCTVREVRNRLRRGERMLAREASPDEIVSAGALVPSRPSRRRQVELQTLLGSLQGDRLGAEAVIAIANGLFVVPAPGSVDSRSPDLIDALAFLG